MVGARGHGIGNYVLDIAAGMWGEALTYELVFLLAPDCPADSVLRRFEHHTSKIPFLHPLEIFSLAGEVAKLNPTLFHSPSFSSLARYPFPLAITVHDLNHLQFGGLFHRLYYRFLLLPALRQARAVASVSQTAAAELDLWMRNHGLKKEVRVVPNPLRPVPGLPAREVLPLYGLEQEKYFFCLSNPKPHKNLDFLVSAYRRAREERPSLPALVLSTEGKSEGGVKHIGSVPSEHIGALLAGARAFFFPSLYEGFGRPPAEAVLEQTAPVVSDIPVLREALTGVNEAIFLPPSDLNAWKEEFLRRAAEEKIWISLASIAAVSAGHSLRAVWKKADAFYREALAGL